QTVSLTGVGLGPAVSLSPTSVAFGSLPVGTGSTKEVYLTNTGTATLNLSSVSVTAGFGGFAACATPSAIPPSGGCTIYVTFSPTTTGSQTGELFVYEDAPGSPQSVPLSGTGTTPPMSLTPSSLAFGIQQVGTTSAAQAILLQNTSGAPLTIGSIYLGGGDPADFGQTNNCVSPLAANTSCTVNVTFTPTLIGTRSAFLGVDYNGTGIWESGIFTGTGFTVLGSLSTSLSFSGRIVGTTSAAQPV